MSWRYGFWTHVLSAFKKHPQLTGSARSPMTAWEPSNRQSQITACFWTQMRENPLTRNFRRGTASRLSSHNDDASTDVTCAFTAAPRDRVRGPQGFGPAEGRGGEGQRRSSGKALRGAG